MKITFLILLIVAIIIFVYYIHGYIINNKLIKKKKSLGISSLDNVYSFKLKFSVSLSIACFIMLLVTIYIVETTSILIPFKSIENYEDEVINVYHPERNSNFLEMAQSTSKTLDSLEKPTFVETGNNIYVIEKGKLISFDIKSKTSTNFYKYKYDSLIEDENIITTPDKIIVSRCGSNKRGAIYVHRMDTLEVVEKIDINGELINVSCSGSNLQIVVINDLEKCVGTDKTLCYLNNKQTKKDYDYTDSYYIEGGIFGKTVSYIKINLNNYDIYTTSFFLTDAFISTSDDCLYIASNVYNKLYEFQKSLVIKFDINSMKVIDEKELKGIIYNPILVIDENNIIANIVNHDNTSNTYTTILMDKKFNLINKSTIRLTVDEILNSTPYFKYKLSEIDGQLKIVTFDTACKKEFDFILSESLLRCGKIVEGKFAIFEAIDNKLYIDNYIFNDDEKNIMLYQFEENIISIQIVNMYLNDNMIRIIYDTENTKGCLKILLKEKLEVIEDVKFNKNEYDKIVFTDNYTILTKNDDISIYTNIKINN